MGYKKGQSGNVNGRPKGAKNKIGSDLRERITTFLLSEFETVEADFQKLKPTERARIYCDLLQYGLPKLQAISMERKLEDLTDSQLDELYNRIINTANNGQ